MTRAQQLLILAAHAAADPRTVDRVLRGGAVRGVVRERIDLAIAMYGAPQMPTEEPRTVHVSRREIRAGQAARIVARG